MGSNGPTSSIDLSVYRNLNLGEYTDEPTLNNSEARIILQKTLEARRAKNGGVATEESEILWKTREHLDLFAAFKELPEAQQAEGIINARGRGLERFEKSQLGSLVPENAEAAKTLIPSLEKKVEDGLVSEEDLNGICEDLARVKRQAFIGT